MINNFLFTTDSQISSFVSALYSNTGCLTPQVWPYGIEDELQKLGTISNDDFGLAVAGKLSVLSAPLIKHLNSTTSMVRQYITKANSSMTVMELPNCSHISWNYFKYVTNARFIPKITKLTLGISQVIESSYAFDALTKIKEINFPNLVEMPPWGCADCHSLTTVSIPKCKRIKEGAFAICYLLSSIYSPEVNYLGESAFAACQALTLFSTNASDTIEIAPSAFDGAENLQVIDMQQASEILCSLGRAFMNCTNLTDFNIGSNTKIMMNSNTQYNFANCTRMKQSAFDNIINHLYSTESLTIATACFRGLWSISYISLPSSIHYLMTNTFQSCVNVTNVNMEGICSISQGAFSDCQSLLKVTFGSNLAYIDSSVFTNDVNLQEINLIAVPGSVHIGANTFPDAASLPSTFRIYVQDSWVEFYKTSAEYNWMPWSSFIYGSSQYPII